MDMIASYITYLTEDKKLSDNTVASYERDIRLYQRYLDDERRDITKATTSVLLGYLNYQHGIGKKPASISRSIASLRSFYAFLCKKGLCGANPADDISSYKPEKRLPEILTNQEVTLLLEQPTGIDMKSLRDKAMLELLYATGIRVTELVMLDMGDVDLDGGYLLCRGGRKQRVIPLHSDAKSAIMQYMVKARELMVVDPNETALFVNLGGKRLTRQGFWKIIKHYRDEAHIDKALTPHTLRHSFAAHLYENGAPLKSIQEMLGHQTLSSTQVYAELSGKRMREVYQSAHPRANRG